MVDIARLGVAVDSSDLVTGRTALKGFAAEGKRTEAQIVKSADRMERELAQTAIAAQNVSKGFNSNGLRMASMQLSQVGQQTMATGNFIQALAIQLPDLALGFGTVGILAGVAAGALLPLAANLLGVGEEAEDLVDQIDKVAAALKAQDDAAELAGMSAIDLKNKYGVFAGTMRSTLQLLSEVAAREAQRQIDGLSESLANLLGTAGSGDSRAAMASFFDVNIMLAFTDKARQARAEARGLTQEFQSAQAALAASNGDIDQQIVATQDMLNAARDLANQKDGINDQEAELIQRLAETLQLMIEQKAATVEAATAAEELAAAAAQVAPGLEPAVAVAQQLKNEMAAALALFNSIAAQESKVYSGRGQDPRRFMEGGNLDGYESRLGYKTPDQLIEELTPKVPKARGASGGGRSSAASKAAREAQKAQNELNRDAERIIEGLRTEQEKYNDDLEQAKRLLDAGVLSQQQYNEHVAQLGQELRDQQPFVQEWKDSMIDAAMGGVDAFDSLRDAIIRAGLEYALFGTGKFAPSGGGGWGGLLAGIIPGLPSNEGGGYTGSGSRTGGVDGRGGILSINHPDETIIDHRKGQSVGGGGQMDVRVYVDDDGKLQAVIEKASNRAVQNAAPGIVGQSVNASQRSFKNSKSGWSP